MEIAVIWLLSAVISTWIGAKKCQPVGAFFLGLIFGPLGIIIAAGSSSRCTCPFCMELVHHKAIVCPHCGRDI